MITVVLVARILLAAVFAVAAVAKLCDLPGSRNAVRAFGIPAPLAPPIGALLPIAEFVIAALLLTPMTAAWAGVGAWALLSVFSVAIVVALIKGRRPDCHCFGQLHSAPAGWLTLGRDLALAAVAGFIAIVGWSDPGPSAVSWAAGVGPTGLTAIGGGLVLTGVLAFQTWFALQLLQQHGRLVLRLETIEAKLDAPSSLVQHSPSAQVAPTAHNEAGLAVRTSAPGFSLQDLRGELVTLDGLRSSGLPLILVFSDPGCGPCNALLPQLARWQATHGDRVSLVPISRGAIDQNRAKATEHGLTRILVQADREVASEYHAFGTPAAVLVDQNGRIASPLAQGAAAIEQLVGRAVSDNELLRRVVQTNGHQPSTHGNRAPSHNGPGSRLAAVAAVGKAAPMVELTDLDGEPVAISDFAGRDLVVLFWNPHCGFCERSLAQLRDWEAHHPPNAPQLLIVATGEPETNRAMGLRSRIALDQTFAAGRAFGATGTPSAIRLDHAGRIATPVAVGATNVLALIAPTSASIAA